MLKSFVCLVTLVCATHAHATRSIDYFLWPATEFKLTLDRHSACELLIERNRTPNTLDLLWLNLLKTCATTSIRASVKSGIEKKSTPKALTEFLNALVNDLNKAQEKYGFDNLQRLGLMTDKEDALALIAYDSFIPTRAELTRLETSLRIRLGQGVGPGTADELKWDLSILQGLTSLHNLAHPNDPVPLGPCNALLTDFIERSRDTASL